MVRYLNENIVIHDLRNTSTLEIAYCSGIGQRENQQDCAFLYADDTAVYAVVCDGMGGLSGGAEASAAAVRSAEQSWNAYLAQPSSSPDWMADAVIAADFTVHELKDENGEPLNAGSTFLSACLQDNQMYWASIGDSRIYVFHGSEAVQVTTDLNYSYILSQRRLAGTISDAEYEREMAQGEALTSFAGIGGVELLDRNLEPLEIQVGDTILLCSDGLYRTIDAQWIQDILSICSTLEDACNAIHQIIEAHGTASQDNYTCILIRIHEQGGETWEQK